MASPNPPMAASPRSLASPASPAPEPPATSRKRAASAEATDELSSEHALDFASRMHWEAPSKDEWISVNNVTVPFFVQRVRKAYMDSFGKAMGKLELIKFICGAWICRKESAEDGKARWLLRFGAEKFGGDQNENWVVILLNYLDVAITKGVNSNGMPEAFFVL